MKKILVLSLFLVTITFSVRAQRPPEDEQHKAKMALLKKDTAYTRFQSKLAAIMKTAKGRKTNVTAVKALFESNKAMFDKLYKQYDIGGLKSANSNPLVAAKPEISKNKLNTIAVKFETYNPPFTEKKIHTFEGYSGITEETGSNASIGKIAYTTSTDDAYLIGPTVYGFRQKIRVPSDPLVVYARVNFHFSFFLTGWDTYFSQVNFYLALQASSNFHSYDYDQIDHFSWPMENWKAPFKLAPRLSCIDVGVITNIYSSVDSSFTLEGYVTPGSELIFDIGSSHPPGSFVGNSGTYHYSEFILKKISVTYLKSGE